MKTEGKQGITSKGNQKSPTANRNEQWITAKGN
jgi:hypothetical protein